MQEVDSIAWAAGIKGEIGRYISNNKPVIVDGVENIIPAACSINDLEKRYGDIEVLVIVSETQKFSYDEKNERTVERLTLSEFIDRGIRQLGSDGKFYALGRSPAAQFPGLLDEIVLPPELRGFISGLGRFLQKNIWMSHGGTRTALHFDAVDNFNIQVEGEKNFRLFPPCVAGMYPYKLNSQASYLSPVDPRSQDVERYPDFPYNEGAEAVLKPGQLLYLPYGWWHQVDTIGEANLNINFWWLPRLKLLTLWPQSLRGAFVLAHRLGSHPHKRQERLAGGNKEARRSGRAGSGVSAQP